MFRRAVRDELIASNPCALLDLERGGRRRERIATPAEAEQLLAALRPDDRALCGCALYAGLRQGELMALDWNDIDFKAGLIRVRRSFDRRNRIFLEPKTSAGTRRVPLLGRLRRRLIEHSKVTGRTSGLVFGVSPTRPFTDSAVRRRAHLAFRTASLNPIGLHESRHSFASLLIAAGVNAKAISTYLGHASIETTFDIYGHLMPGNENVAADLVERFLANDEDDHAPDEPRTG